MASRPCPAADSALGSTMDGRDLDLAARLDREAVM
jgi:hypothetical protein